MRDEEAAWIGAVLGRAADAELSPLVELGSSTAEFRRTLRPHIDALIHAPLRARGVPVVHVDQKAAEGVDVSGDIYDPAVQARIGLGRAGALLCCNMFEHVTDRPALAAICDALLRPGGLLVVTVPHSYPHHPDPIDTGYRPSPEAVAALFPGYATLAARVIESGGYGRDLLAGPSPGRTAARRLAHLAEVWAGPRRWRERNHRLLWLLRPYRISAVALRKPERACVLRDASCGGSSG